MAHVGWALFKMPGKRRCLRKLNGCLGCRLPLFPLLVLSLLGALALLFAGRRDWSKDQWVSLAPKRLLVYSAWSEPRGDVHEVRVIALLASRGALRGRLLCTLAYLNYSHVQVVAARVDPLNATVLTGHPTGHSLEPGFVFCPGDPQLQADEVGLRLVDTSRVHWLPVGHAPSTIAYPSPATNGGKVRRLIPRRSAPAAIVRADGVPAAKFGAVVCALSVLDAATEDRLLGEFVAHYTELGATHFVFYNRTQSRRARTFFGALTTVVSVEYLPWTRRDARSLLAYDCALRMRGRADVLAAVDTDERLVPWRALAEGAVSKESGGYAADWRLSDVRGSLVRLSRKTFCGADGDVSQGAATLLSRGRRLGDIEPAGVVVADLNALLAGTLGTHHSRRLLVHRYSDAECPAGAVVVDKSAAEVERRTQSSQAMILWRALFVS
ncbi:uncharacterized protein LOC142571757 [Dermacentor variabilis]|uniref:uncharacterized protein LOC142571757 n=1 Tax=Dermacentor variabilis TaxID=34621 RepID=UPI003F5C47EE